MCLPGADAKNTSNIFSSCHRPTFPMILVIWSPDSSLAGVGRAGSVSLSGDSSPVSLLVIVTLPSRDQTSTDFYLFLEPTGLDWFTAELWRKINCWFEAILVVWEQFTVTSPMFRKI